MSKQERSYGSEFCQLRSRKACDGESSAVSCLPCDSWQQSIALCHQLHPGSTRDSSQWEERAGGLFSTER